MDGERKEKGSQVQPAGASRYSRHGATWRTGRAYRVHTRTDWKKAKKIKIRK